MEQREEAKTFRKFLRLQANKYFDMLEYDALFFVNSGKIFVYPGGVETTVGYGKEMNISYEEYLKREGTDGS